MTKSFDYMYVAKAEDSITVDDIGNTCISALNDMGKQWFLVIKTFLGETSIWNFGPFDVDKDNYFKNGFNFNFISLNYDEKKICRHIDNFINDAKKMITQVIVEDNEFNPFEKLQNIKFNEM